MENTIKLFRTIRFFSAVLFFLFPTIWISLSGSSYASGKIDVTDIRYWSYPDYTRVVISLTENPDYAGNRLSNPDRLYFDIKNSLLKKDLQKTISVGNGMLKTVRAGQFNDSTVRVVLDLGKMTNYKVLTMEDPNRLVIDIYGEKQTASVKKRIVLDPGHGGHDPGAVGQKNLYEKDVVLDIALKLKKILADDPNLEIFLTRETDVFIPLEQRTTIAISKNADLFLSIHANTSPRRDARGIETYFLNWTNDEEAMKVAARENAISLKKMKKMNEGKDVLDVMLSSLRRDNKRDESLKLANIVQQNMVNGLNRNYNHIVDHGVKQALFYVLFGADMPSVLVEVSFISNPLEEKLLSKDAYRSELAKSLATGINKYMTAVPEGQSVARNGRTVVP
ncbi:MAG: N-acetylmuramoyl-L-alanine amidase [Nitrospirae bacterium]|nr:N-acetylmuramoyl-L-alanine amidase [Nitrospirota bacterium]